MEEIGKRMMAMALDNLERDGYVSYVVLAISHTNELAPIIPQMSTREDKEHFDEADIAE